MRRPARFVVPGAATLRPGGLPAGPSPRIASAPAVATATDARPLKELEASGLAPVEMTAAAVEGYPPLPSYRAKVRNVSDRPIRRVVATVVYLDAAGRRCPVRSTTFPSGAR